MPPSRQQQRATLGVRASSSARTNDHRQTRMLPERRLLAIVCPGEDVALVLVVEAARRRNAFWRGLGVMVIGIGVVLTVWICVAGRIVGHSTFEPNMGAYIRDLRGAKTVRFWDNWSKMKTKNTRGGNILKMLMRSEFSCDSESGVKMFPPQIDRGPI